MTANETSKGMKFDDSLVKELTGEDTVAARHIYKSTFEFEPAFKLVIRGNHKPSWNGADSGMARRLRLVPFDMKIAAGRKDKNLKQKLRAELSGILNWAIAGCLRWQERGLSTPAMVQIATHDYLKENDRLGEFIDRHMKADEEERVSTDAVFKQYQSWCTDAGVNHTLTRHMLTSELRQRGFKYVEYRESGKHKHGFSGIRLDPESRIPHPFHKVSLSTTPLGEVSKKRAGFGISGSHRPERRAEKTHTPEAMRRVLDSMEKMSDANN